nr:EOG090X0LFN [Macrothrix elegans]
MAQVEQATGVALPSFYNPAAVNPMKYAEQVQKRKLLWSGKEKKETTAPSSNAKLWEVAAFKEDQDGKMTAKFKRLMGIKNDGSEPSASALEPSCTNAAVATSNTTDPSTDVLKKQQELFASLDQQYQVARAATHTQRGLGLGFSSFPR